MRKDTKPHNRIRDLIATWFATTRVSVYIAGRLRKGVKVMESSLAGRSGLVRFNVDQADSQRLSLVEFQ